MENTQKGGARAGAGRPKSARSLAREKANDIMSRMVLKEIVPLTQVLIEKGLDGDIQAIKELFDRGLGKVSQNVDLSSDGKALPAPLLFALFNASDKPETIKADYIVEPVKQLKDKSVSYET
jgi:hypothetical protein